MCDTCGCGQPGNEIRIIKPGADKDTPGEQHTHTHAHPHIHDGQEHEHSHTHSHQHEEARRVQIEQDVLGRNKLVAEHNRGYFEALNILTLNLVSSPGSGKTCLLERTIRDLKDQFPLYIIEGDQQTLNDADRILAAGAPVVQVNTGQGCHLDADMVSRAIRELDPARDAILMIENVGNLVCPAMFDLGESQRIVIMSVTEGEDKPVKYPYMFISADLCILNKTDLLPYLDFDLSKAREYARMVNPGLEIIELSVKSGEGLEQWYQWLKNKKAGIK